MRGRAKACSQRPWRAPVALRKRPSRRRSLVAPGSSVDPLEAKCKATQHRTQNEVDDADQRVRFNGLKGVLSNTSRDSHQFADREERQHRTRFEIANSDISEWRNYDLEGLRQNHLEPSDPAA